MKKSDVMRLQHMRDWLEEALQIAEGHKRSDLETDRNFCYALIRCIEVIGEAASKISEECKNQHTHIPWFKIIGMRNRLIHAYQDVELDIVWKTAINELPILKEELEKIFKNLSSQENL